VAVTSVAVAVASRALILLLFPFIIAGLEWLEATLLFVLAWEGIVL